MKRVYIFLVSVFSLFIISLMFMGLIGMYQISFTINPTTDLMNIILIAVIISIGGPITGFVIYFIVRTIYGLFKPKFIRIADNLEHQIDRNRVVTHKLGIPLREAHVIDRMERIWEKGGMQYPYSELNFDKKKSGDYND